ncbi:pyrroloquinoline quinone-dependent dehydrogenase [Horticoccus sp. 23ND18S-11]|uniref:pyrroloquinoline quinone-dependent dehydrogenase n=1 Tax=Horticoccus sp. 23ND18S-11 TaxID=3391832 RepID=UPI0039C99290
MNLLPRFCLGSLGLAAGLGLALPARAQVEVSYERLVHAADEPGNWLTYSGNYAGHRHSPLAQITPANVGGLKAAWIYQAREAAGKLECSPLVIDGVLYITERPNIVTALDGRTGRPLWTYRRPLPGDVQGCCGPVNRGLAVLGDTLFLATYDAHLVALDVNSGRERWDVVVADYKTGHSITVAPLAVKDKIIVGISGGEFGVRGFLDAYDARTGARAWRFWTVPGPGEAGHETWGGRGSWKTGGAPTWVTGTFDPALNLLYWGTGNPSPEFDGDDRPGDNLYSCSMLALDPDTGKLRWHFQHTPHDLHDRASNQIPVLIDATIDGRPRQLLVQANRNGFYYVLDRTTGEFITGTAFSRVTWASGLDARGRPILNPDIAPSAAGSTVLPGLGGATNWQSPAFNPATRLFYVLAVENNAETFFKYKTPYEPGAMYLGGEYRAPAGQEATSVVKALDAVSGKLHWEFPLNTASMCGVMSTAGGLVFGGSREGWFYALDASTGKPLWRFATGGSIMANPVSFLVGGRQHIAIAAASSIVVFSL